MAYIATRPCIYLQALIINFRSLQDATPAMRSTALDMIEPASLPPGWTAQFDEAQERRYYVHADSDTVRWSHPRLGYYKGIVFMESGGLALLMESIESDPPASSDLAAMAEYLSIQDSDDPLVKEVALFACCAPLPPSYAEEEDSSGAVRFRCAPLESFRRTWLGRQIYLMARLLHKSQYLLAKFCRLKLC